MQIPTLSPTSTSLSAAPTSPSSASGFGDLLTRAAAETNHSQILVESMTERMAAGDTINPAELAAAVNKADLAFRTMVQIRNKLVVAFNELRQMQV